MKNWKTSSLGLAGILAVLSQVITAVSHRQMPDGNTLEQWIAMIAASWSALHAADASTVKKIEQKVDDNTTAIMQTNFPTTKP